MSLNSCKVKHTGQESGGELREIIIVSAVKICKQCLQTTSASDRLRLSPQTLYRALPLGLDSQVPQTRWAITSKTKIHGDATDSRSKHLLLCRKLRLCFFVLAMPFTCLRR